MSSKHQPDEIVQSFDDYKNLSSQEKDFFTFQSIYKISHGMEDLLERFNLDALDKRYDGRYAIKSLENAVTALQVKVGTKVEQIDDHFESFRKVSDAKYAEKKVEVIIYRAIGVVLMAVLVAGLSYIVYSNK